MSIIRRAAGFAFLTTLLFAPLAVRAAAIPQEAIDRASERGAAALRKMQAPDGSFSPNGGFGSGPTSLATLALIECGDRPDVEHIRKAVAVVRADCPTMNRTYNLSLAIMLLDRVGDPLDEPIIHVLTVRLLEGQAASGAWDYTTPDVSAEETQTVRTLIERRPEMKTAPGDRPAPRSGLSPDIKDRLARLEQRQTPGNSATRVDNSNTQFAVLACWIGRRHGIPTDAALRKAEAHFRSTHVNGRWGYVPNTDVVGDYRVANTCAGLLGLAIGTGLVREKQMRTETEGKGGKPQALRDPMKDAVVQAAMNYVGGQVAELAATGLNADVNKDRGLYFLWSLERVGMIYSVAHMGGVDWYQAGAATILRAQLPDGSWGQGRAGPLVLSPDVSASFALLFLKRSNFAHDLTANLRAKSRPVTMRSGGDKAESPDEKISEAERLARELLAAQPERQTAILNQLRDGKGNEFTDALAHVIPKLTGDVQKKARDFLAERLARMTVTTVRSKLKDENAEVRRASALACAMKEDQNFVPDLIGVLEDKDAWVVRAAAVALRTLTGQDFGPPADATTEQRSASIAAWKAWWKRQNGK
jgi:hypothetical protein